METVAEKKIPPPLPPKTRRGCLKNGDGGGATILSNGHVVKIRIDPMMGIEDVGERDDEKPKPRREHAVGRRSSTVKINITCVEPFVFHRHYNDDDDDDEEDDRRSSSGHQSPLDSGTGSDLETGSRRDESDDGTCSCDSLTSSTADPESAVLATPAVVITEEEPIVEEPAAAIAAPVVEVPAVPDPAVVIAAAIASVVEEWPKQSSPVLPAIHVQQRCYGDVATANATTTTAMIDRVIDMDNTDQYYSFHMNENVFDEVDATTVAATTGNPTEDTFAGCKTAAASDTIRSAKGTIRGVKNRVRAGIATFLQPKTNKVSTGYIFLILTNIFHIDY